MNRRYSDLRAFCALGLAVCLSFASVGCGAAVGDPSGTTPADHTAVGQIQPQLILDAKELACGEPEHVAFTLESEENGELIECIQPMSPATIPNGWFEGLPDGDDGSEHLVGDCLFLLDAGFYMLIEIVLLDGDLEVLECCEWVEGPQLLTVVAEQTLETPQTMNCATNQKGGHDIPVVVNRQPQIVDIDIQKFNPVCDEVTVTIWATDADNDPLEYHFELVSGEPGASVDLSWVEGAMTVSVDTPGTYWFKVRVTDPAGLQSTLDFPLHFAPSDC